MKEPSQSFVFTGVAERPIPSLNRGFSAPIKLILPIDVDDLRFLAAHDRDPFNRWQAVQTLAMSLLTANVVALRAGHRCATTRASWARWTPFSPTPNSSPPSSR